MRFLKLRTNTQPRANGEKSITPLIVDSPRRFSKQRKEKALCKKRCQLISGAHDSGKSRWLNRLHENAAAIWGKKSNATPVYLSALQPLAGWLDNDAFVIWYNGKAIKEASVNDPEGELASPKLWCNLTQQYKLALLSEYILENKAIVFVDDAHKLTGRKAQIARECVMSANLWVITTIQENRLPPSLRAIVERRNPQRTKLVTDVSYDATGIFTWLLVLGALLIGWWEVSLVLGGLKLLGSGRRASRAD